MRKFSKTRKGRNKGVSKKGNTLLYYKMGLISLSNGFLTDKIIESGRKVIMNYTKRLCNLIIRIKPCKPVTKKPLEVRMGNGKGNFLHNIFVIKPGRIIFEINSKNSELSFKALKASSYKFPIKTKIIINDRYNL
ncbi:50S ribosomal protein L16 [Candidatus Vidania fulgoroideorum]